MDLRSAIIVNCSKVESDLIHEQAQIERRTISGYVLKAVLSHAAFEEKHLLNFPEPVRALDAWKRLTPVPGPRTTFLVRCSRIESERIRAGAKRRDITISGYVLNTLRRSWKAQMAAGTMPLTISPVIEEIVTPNVPASDDR